MLIPSKTLSLWKYETFEQKFKFKESVGKSIFPRFQTLDKVFEDEKRFELLKFNVSSIDNLLRGGVDLATLTEIYGGGGSGKTQLCLQLAFNCRLPRELGGSAGKVMYLSTDKTISGRRLLQFEAAFKQKYTTDVNFLEGIFITELNKAEDFQEFVKDCLPQYFQIYKDLKLLIIDSIAGIFRIETNYIKRSKTFSRIFQHLNILAQQHNFAIVCTNHLTAVPDVGEFAALGNTWSTLVTTRMCVKKLESICSVKIDDKEEISRLRKIKVEFSPRLPPNSADFCITSRGIENAPEINF